MMTARLLVTVACFVIGGQISECVPTPTVPTTSGFLHGQNTDVLRTSVVQFLGVPYAEPPVGHLRFRPPQELYSATEARKATQYGPSCYQPPHTKELISPILNTDDDMVSEDCLTLNIFVPKHSGDQDQRFPVMVWLPGEGFDYASASQFDGSYLAALGQVIVVTVNYRVSVFGFLSTLTQDAPGNVGLLDQRMALKWIQKNIDSFGGDPNRVTLFGRFTGSMSASLHLTSPLNQIETLFHGVILQSGIATGDWVFDKEPLNATMKLAEVTNCSSPSLSKTVSCLQKVPADVLLAKSFHVPQRFRPVFDHYLINEEPLDVIDKNNHAPVDTMIGVNNNDGSICLLMAHALKSSYYQKIIDNELTAEDFADLIGTNILDFYKKKDTLITEVAVHEYEFMSHVKDLREKYVDFCSDLYIISRMVKMANNLALNKKGRVYVYEFAHRPTFSIQPSFIRAGLGDDVLFTLGLVHQLESASAEELLLSNRTIAAFSNFARNGMAIESNSVIQWPEYQATDRQVMTFATSVVPVSAKDSYDRGVSLWHDIVPQLQHCLQGQRLRVVAWNVTLQEANEPSGKEVISRHVYFLGTSLSLTAAEYALLVLFCFCVVLSVTTTLSLVPFCKSSRHEEYFPRLR